MPSPASHAGGCYPAQHSAHTHWDGGCQLSGVQSPLQRTATWEGLATRSVLKVGEKGATWLATWASTWHSLHFTWHQLLHCGCAVPACSGGPCGCILMGVSMFSISQCQIKQMILKVEMQPKQHERASNNLDSDKIYFFKKRDYRSQTRRHASVQD